MVEHAKALALKGIMTLVVLYLVLGLGFEMSFVNVLIITVVLGAVSYVAGDMYILPKTNNMTATISDLGVAFVVILLMGMLLTTMSITTLAGAAAISALIMALGEYPFHIYLQKNDLGTSSGNVTASVNRR